MSKFKKYMAIVALSLSGGSIYLLPYLKYIFYDQMVDVMQVTNTQMGTMMSMYAIGCMLLYIPGGILADKLSSRKSLIVSLILTAILTVLYGVTLNYTMSMIIWFLLSITTSFVFWTSLIKAIGQIGTAEEQGRMYGIYYAGNGLTQAICNSIALKVFSQFQDPVQGLKMAVFTLAAANIFSAIMVYFFIEKGEPVQSENNDEKFSFKEAKNIIKKPLVWLISGTILCAYSIFSTSTYFTPYLSEVVGISEETSSMLAIIRSNIFLVIGAPIGGYIVDKLRSTSKWFIIGNLLAAVTFFIILVIPVENQNLIIGATLVPSLLTYMLYGVAFSIVGECKFPAYVTGTVIGIASIVGYLPDFYMSNVCGVLLDNLGGAGYNYIFAMLGGLALLGAGLSFAIRKKIYNKDGSNKEVVS